ncbi:MAG TPA: hypothetical protein VF158_13560 [Longimicrobiales bacterium]
MRYNRVVFRVPSLALAVLLGVLSVAVPILDRDAGHDLPAFESEGASATCVVGHDHGICTQHGANPIAPAPVQEPAYAAPADAAPLPSRERGFHRSVLVSLRPSRAPPCA